MATRLAAANRIADNGRMLVAYPSDADGYLPLKTSVVGRGILGAITYTRATPATVTDNEGVIRNVKSGEARFQGARRVENMTAYSKTFTNPTWTKANLLTVTGNAIAGPAGLGMATSLIETATTTQHGIITSTSYANVAGNVYISSFYAKAGARSFVQLLTNGAISLEYANFDLVNGIFSQSSAGVGAMVSVGDGWYRCSIKYTSLSSTTAVVYCMIGVSLADVRYQSYVGDGVSNVYIDAHQHEDVTGQSIQTAGEYVSTNVLTSAPYHGANVDGVKYFDTDLNGTPIPASILKGYFAEGARTNLFINTEDLSLWGLIGLGAVTGNATTGPDGRMTASLFTLSALAGAQGITQSTTTTAAVHAQSIYVKPNGHNYIQCNADSGISLGYVNFDLSTGTVGSSSLWTGTIESRPNGWYRLKIITNTISATTANVSFAAVPSATSTRGSSVAGAGSTGFYLAKPQFELGPSVSSYIPSAAMPTTRNIDVLTYNVRNVIANQGAFSAVFSMDDNEIFDRRALNLSSFTINRLHIQARTLGVPAISIAYGDGVTVRGVTGVAAGTNNIAVAWTNGVGLNLYMNNIKYIGAFVPSLAFTTIDVGGGVLGYSLFGCVKNLRIWKTLPTDTELLLLSNNP